MITFVISVLHFLPTSFLRCFPSSHFVLSLFVPILSLSDAVAGMWNTSWCCQTKQNVMTCGYGIDGKNLLHGAVVWFSNGNVVSDLRVDDA